MTELSRHVVAEWVRSQRLASPVTKLILQLTFDHAGPQEDGRWVAWVGNKTLAWEACFKDGPNAARTVRKHLADLEAAGIIEREERSRGNGSQTTNRVVLLIPAGWPDLGGRAEQTGGVGPDSPPQKPQEEAPTRSGGQKRASAGAKEEPVTVHRLPDDLPEHLHDAAIAAGRVLYRTATARGQHRVVLLEAVGRAVSQRPTKDHVAVAEKVEHWLCWGKGQTKPCDDVVLRFRNFLVDAEDVRLPDGSPLSVPAERGPNVHPIRQGQARNANGKPTHAELIGELRAANPRLHPELAANQLPART